MDDPIIEQITSLSREDAMEAALALRDTFDAEEGNSDAPYVAAVAESPHGHVVEVDALARLVLLAGAADPALRSDVEEALAKVGQTAFILGGAEIVALAALGAYVFTSVQSGGIASRTTQVEVKKDGSVKYKDETIYNSGSPVMKALLGWLRLH
jgi:hypothetical protein